MPGWWSLPAQTLSRIGSCPDRRYGGNLFYVDLLASFFSSALGRRNPDRTGASKLYLLPLIVQGRGLLYPAKFFGRRSLPQGRRDAPKAFPLGGRCPSAHTGADEGRRFPLRWQENNCRRLRRRTGQPHFFLLAQKETGLDPKEKGPATGLPGMWSLSAQTLSRIGPCPDRRYGGNLVHADSFAFFINSALGRRNPDRTGASKPYLLPLIV